MGFNSGFKGLSTKIYNFLFRGTHYSVFGETSEMYNNELVTETHA